jgi:hypothetical protein
MLDKLLFPYNKAQIILSSDRVLLHSKKDAIILAGKRAVSICSTETINLDAKEKIILDCDIVELGHEAQALGENVILGRTLVNQLKNFCIVLQSVGQQMSRVAEGDNKIAASITVIMNQGFEIESAASTLLDSLDSTLSQNTYTR